MNKQTSTKLVEPDIVTGAFSVRRMADVPATIGDALADLEVRRVEGTTPVLICGDLAILYLADFLGGEG